MEIQAIQKCCIQQSLLQNMLNLPRFSFRQTPNLGKKIFLIKALLQTLHESS